MLARTGKYDNCIFHRLGMYYLPAHPTLLTFDSSTGLHGMTVDSILAILDSGAFQIQTGDPTGTGSGGQSYWGTPFRDEYDLKGAATHDSRGILAMANKGASTNGYGFCKINLSQLIPFSSQFYITFKAASHLDRKHTVFGKLVGGEDVLDALEKLPRKAGTERPIKSVEITEVVMQVPFIYFFSK